MQGEVKFAEWQRRRRNASMLAFGNLGTACRQHDRAGWLDDVKNPQSAQVLAKQYQDKPTTDAARMIAHKFADEIIFRLGGAFKASPKHKLSSSARAVGTKKSG